jgi:propionyl-CoA carboxylase alpha chain
VLASLPSGWRNNPSQRQWIEYALGEDTLHVEYRVLDGLAVEASVAEEEHRARILSTDAASIVLEVDKVRRRFDVVAHGEWRYVDSVLGSAALRVLPRFPQPESEHVEGGCTAPMPGKILSVRVRPGDAVRKGQILVILEAMKMEHQVVAPADGTVREVRVDEGQQVEAGSILVVLEEATAASEGGQHE